MVYLAKKKKKGNVYLYLEHRVKIDGKSKPLFSIYLGPEKKFIQQGKLFNLDLDFNLQLKTFDFGLPVALLQIAEKLRLREIIDETTNKRDQGLSVGQYLLIATLNRCVQPRSKSQLKDWFQSTYLQKLIPNHQHYLDANAYYYHFPYLTDEAIEEIEIKLLQVMRKEFQLEMNQILYDPTNFSTFIEPDDQTLPRHGKAKDGRNTLNLIGLSMFCTREDGIPLLHRTYPGNLHDAELFKTELPRFIQLLKSQSIENATITLTFDKGVISKELFEHIEGTDIKWVCTTRPSSHKDLQHLVPADFQFGLLPNKKLVGIYQTKRTIHGTERRLIVIFNPLQQHWNVENFRRKLSKRITYLQKFFAEKLNVKKWRDPKKVNQKIENYIGKKYLTFVNYQVEGEYADLTLEIIQNEKAAKRFEATLGKAFLISNIDNRTPAIEVIWSYRQQFTIERAFS
ncbi:MAG: IS1634 family transposase, partial [Candidatus Heimdallarchaeota archaeon]